MFPIFAGNSASTGYNLTRSLRFRSSASAYLSRTPASAGNRQTWTWSGWVKRGSFTDSTLFSGWGGSGLLNTSIQYSTDTLRVITYNGSTSIMNVQGTPVYRDPSGWYHVVVAIDTTQATSTNRAKLYINGVQITAFTTTTYPSLNDNTYVNTTNAHTLGQVSYLGASYFDGYLTEINFIDGQALTPSSFGSTNALTGVWQPARYTGTYGTNGFYLPFTDNSALTTSSNVGLGKDFSGNGNYWTTNNISLTAGVTYDSMTDVPTLTSATAANYAVANPLQSGSYVTASNGNLTVTGNTSANSALALGSIGNLTSGKWYWEYTQGTVQSETCGITTTYTAGTSLINGENIGAYGIGARAAGTVYGGTVGSITSWTVGDVIGLAVDCDNGAIYWSKNGTWLNSGVPTSGASKTGAVGIWTPSSSINVTPAFGAYNGGFVSLTFGQRPFTYTPPTGFVALNTFNLPTSTIVKGNTVMDATLYTGNGSTQTITNAAGFKPDFVWIKARGQAFSHILTDSVRGNLKVLSSDQTAAEFTEPSGITLTSTGFSSGVYASTNNNTYPYVGWQWQAGQGSTSSNTNGTITSTVSVNAAAGFSVVTWTANGSANQTIGHGLGVTPSLVIVKHRNDVDNWAVWITGFSSSQFLRLNTTDSTATSAGFWNATPTSSVFSVGSTGTSINVSGGTYVAYCWTPIAGFSAFGSYTGNGSTDGTFVYTGFRPKFIMIKRSDTAGNYWRVWDSTRATYNAGLPVLYPNVSDVEDSISDVYDLVSNGFKLRTSAAGTNASSSTYIYMAFAESPFRNSLAR